MEVLTTEKRAHAGPILPFTTEKLALALTLAQFLFFRAQCFHFILEVLTTEKRDSAIWVNDSTLRLALALAQFYLFFRGQCFHCILEVLNMEKQPHPMASSPALSLRKNNKSTKQGKMTSH